MIVLRRTRVIYDATKRFTILLVLLIGLGSGCRGHEELPQVRGPVAIEVALPMLIENPANYDGDIVRVVGWCRIEFEGNVLYITEDSLDRRRATEGVWLNLGWPVDNPTRSLDKAHVAIEGRFDAKDKGRSGMYGGTLTQIRLMEPLSDKSR
jgi:hypothetical protein